MAKPDIARGMKVDIQWRPTVKQLGDFVDDYKEQFAKAMDPIVDRVISEAEKGVPKNLWPKRKDHKKGLLKSTLRSSVTKTYGTIAIGYKAEKKAVYAARVHWGRITEEKPKQQPKDWFLWRVVYPQATIKKSGPMAQWITDEVQKFANKAIADFNRKGGPKHFKANKAPR